MKTGRRIEELNLRRLHKLRLRGKRMRYTIEFAKGLYDKESKHKRIERTLKDLAENLQSALGTLNDIASGKAIMDRIISEGKVNRKDYKSGTTSRLATMIFGDEKRQSSKQLSKVGRSL